MKPINTITSGCPLKGRVKEMCGHHPSYWNGQYCELCAEIADREESEYEAREAARKKRPATEVMLEKAGWQRRGCDEWADPETGQRFPASVAIKIAEQEKARK